MEGKGPGELSSRDRWYGWNGNGDEAIVVMGWVGWQLAEASMGSGREVNGSGE